MKKFGLGVAAVGVFIAVMVFGHIAQPALAQSSGFVWLNNATGCVRQSPTSLLIQRPNTTPNFGSLNNTFSSVQLNNFTNLDIFYLYPNTNYQGSQYSFAIPNGGASCINLPAAINNNSESSIFP